MFHRRTLGFCAVSKALPSVTVLIPARAEQANVKAATAARALHYPPDLIEIIVARGTQPSAQRNQGIRAAKGELIYFLDDDSIPQPENLQKAVSHFQRPDVWMLGGPNVCPPDAPAIEQVFAVVLGAWLAFGPSRARYVPVGQLRETSEKELILCNLLARRSKLLESGGFNESLYPNEENALMDEFRKKGGKLLYDPGFIVFRRPRASLTLFIRMLMTYGRGRAEQFRCNPTPGSALNFVPPVFCLYLLTLPLALWLGIWWLAPLAFYLAVVAAQGVQLVALAGPLRGLAATPLVALTHVFYGLGFWKGLFTQLRRHSIAPVKVSIQKVA